ncbi:MAG: hypothetical protein GX230_01900 [Lentisphaerae bacterium]|jgi:hypothetical protein|nr:hypothetical protein [Lentisphaerota bacterium]
MRKVIPGSKVTDVSDAVIWRSIVGRRPESAVDGDLAQALELARRQDFNSAYLALARHHCVTLQSEWDLVAGKYRNMESATEGTLADIYNHKFNVWHKQVIQFGREIEWYPEGYDIDNIHGLHRLSFTTPALVALIKEGDKRARDFFVDLIAQYNRLQQHPRWPEIRPIAYCYLNTAAKWPILLAAYLALINGGEVSGTTIGDFQRTFYIFGRWTSASLKEYVPGWNAQVVAYTTLLHVARCFPEYKEAGVWDDKAVGLLRDHAAKGFYADGGNKERVWGYGVMHLSGLTTPYGIARRMGGLGGSERKVYNAIRRVYQWYVKSVAPPPDYAFPTYGDAGLGAHDALPTVTAMVREVLPAVEHDTNLGIDRNHGYLLKESGFAVMRNGDTLESTYVNLDFGKFAGWHSHWDLLSMNLWAYGKPLLEELCRFGAYANPLDTLFRAPESHNLMLIDGMIYDSREVQGEDVQWYSDDKVEYFSAFHRAYRYFVFGRETVPVSPNIEARIRRTVLLVKDPGYVVVVDLAEDVNHCDFNRSVSQYWHSPTPFEVLGRDRVRTTGDEACLLVYAHKESLHRLDTGKDFGGAEVEHLGHAYERYNLRARRWMPLNHQGGVGFTTVIYPFRGELPEVNVRSLASSGGKPWQSEALEIETQHGKDLVIINPMRLSGLMVGRRRISERFQVHLGGGRGDVSIH